VCSFDGVVLVVEFAQNRAGHIALSAGYCVARRQSLIANQTEIARRMRFVPYRILIAEQPGKSNPAKLREIYTGENIVAACSIYIVQTSDMITVKHVISSQDNFR